MCNIDRLPWHKLIELADTKGAKTEWQDFPEEFLVVTNELASALPCRNNRACYMNVVCHAPDDIVGICTSDVDQCDPVILNKSELILYRLDYRKLANKVADAIGFIAYPKQIEAYFWKFGILNPLAEYSFPAYCFLGQISANLDGIVNRLCMAEEQFLLIVSNKELISNAAADISNRHKSKLIAIEDIFSITAGKVIIKARIKIIIKNWLATLLPKAGKPGEEYYFQTPVGAKWENFVFEFIAKETLLVTCKEVQKRLEPEHLKMKHQQSGKPTLQWSLLCALAVAQGDIYWQDKIITNQIKKQKQELTHKLKQTFGLSEDPIFWSRSERGYKTRFVIKAAMNVSRQVIDGQ